MKTSEITVLVAVKDSGRFLRGCLDSLLAQSAIKKTEVVVIDGGSLRGDREIVREYQEKWPVIRYLSIRKPGLYHTWNLGIRASRGRYLTNLNADDRLREDALEIMADRLDKNPGAALVYGDSYITSKPNETLAKNSSHGRRFRWPEYSHRRLLVHCFCGPHPMWRRQLHREFGYFDESYKIAGDYDFWLRVAERYEFLRIPEVVGLYYNNPRGLVNFNPDLYKEEVLKVKRRHFNSR